MTHKILFCLPRASRIVRMARGLRADEACSISVADAIFFIADIEITKIIGKRTARWWNTSCRIGNRFQYGIHDTSYAIARAIIIPAITLSSRTPRNSRKKSRIHDFLHVFLIGLSYIILLSDAITAAARTHHHTDKKSVFFGRLPHWFFPEFFRMILFVLGEKNHKTKFK